MLPSLESHQSPSDKYYYTNHYKKNKNTSDLYSFEEEFEKFKKIYNHFLSSSQNKSNLNSILKSVELKTLRKKRKNLQSKLDEKTDELIRLKQLNYNTHEEIETDLDTTSLSPFEQQSPEHTLVELLDRYECTALEEPLDKDHPLILLMNATSHGLNIAIEYLIKRKDISWEKLFTFLTSPFNFDRRSETIQNQQFLSLLLEKFKPSQAYAIILSLLLVIHIPAEKRDQITALADYFDTETLLPLNMIVNNELTFLYIACLVNEKVKMRALSNLMLIGKKKSNTDINRLFDVQENSSHEKEIFAHHTGLLIIRKKKGFAIAFIQPVSNNFYLFLPTRKGLITIKNKVNISQFLSSFDSIYKATFFE